MKKKLPVLFLSSLLLAKLTAQVCTFPGQTPASAILICSPDPVIQNTPTFCGQSQVPVNCIGNPALYENVNPNFFRMACYTSGTLGFVIHPSDLNANYDWQLFDVTNTNPFDIFTNPALFRACNWSPEPGETGASADGTDIMVCNKPGENTFSLMPDIIKGHTYLLMVCNPNASQGNYQLSFEGGNASIADTTQPHLWFTSLNCNATNIFVRLNKPLKCSSIAPDGSDFSLNGGIIITGATPGSCGNSFGTDTVILTLAQPLPIGNYTLTVNNGTDGNTLVDICGNSVLAGENIPVKAGPLQPTLMDSARSSGCSPSYIDLVFKKPVLCSSIAPDASDFIITGPQAVTAKLSNLNCSSGTSVVIRLDFTEKLITPGVYTVKIKTGTDGNTIIDECGLQTPAGSSVTFDVRSPVSAQFSFSTHSSCKADTLYFFHDGNNGVQSWSWKFDNNPTSTSQNTTKIISDTITHHMRLIVSNGACSDTSQQVIRNLKRVFAGFITPPAVCPGDMAIVQNKSYGPIDRWEWNFGNGTVSYLPSPPPQSFTANGRFSNYTIRLVVINDQTHCSDTAKQVIRALPECFVQVPSAFTPNGDGLNDYMGPLNTGMADNLEFRVYGHFGQLVFLSGKNGKGWDGVFRGVPQNSGLYAWLITYTDHYSGKRVLLKGTTLLLR